jgi:hypothetical protein
MSLTAVYFDSQEVYAGQYHKHPYGEINCIVQIDPTFELEGLPVNENWQGAGEFCLKCRQMVSMLTRLSQVGQAPAQEHTTTQGPEEAVVSPFSSFPRDGSHMMPSQEILNLKFTNSL